VDVFSEPVPNERKQDLTADALKTWNSRYRTKIAFHKDFIFFISNTGLYIHNQMNPRESFLGINMDYCTLSFGQKNSKDFLLLKLKDGVDLGYGYSRQLSFDFDESSKRFHSSDYYQADKYFKGNDDDRLLFSFVTSMEEKKEFYINTKINGIIVNQNPDDETQFYKIIEYKDGFPVKFCGMFLRQGGLNNFLKPEFIPTDEVIMVSDESINTFYNSGIFNKFSFKRWAVGEKSDFLKTQKKDKKKPSIKKPDAAEKPKSLRKKIFYYISRAAIIYSIGSLLQFLYWKFGKF
jgi:hypothetical protein